jgi:histidine triad (HIT) family protein
MNDDAVRASCLFCKIADGHIPATIVYSDDHVVAFRDINPQAPTHVLVIPRRHYANAAAAVGSDVWDTLMTAAASIAAQEGLNEGGYRLVINSGPDAGQSVDHLHVHVLGGRALAWPPG